jgi:dTDP-4-dehydrorhamnose reductase
LSFRILFTGVTSIHGWPLFEAFSSAISSVNVLGIRSPKMKIPSGPNLFSCCITDKDKLYSFKKQFNPTHVIHCAGVCDLDVCEERPEWAYSMNVVGSKVVADLFGEDCKIVYMSSDLVFSGNKSPLTGYNEEHVPDPVSVAGSTIAAAELQIKRCPQHLILRLGLPIGRSVTGTKGAVDFIETRLRKNLPITLFHDEWRSCILCDDIARASMEMITKELSGLYNLGGPQKVSLYEIGHWILRGKNYNQKYLKGILRAEEKNGPPRMGDVSMNSSKAQKKLSFQLVNPLISIISK